MSTFTLTGTGVQALATPNSLAVVVTVGAATAQRGNANPPNLFQVGLLRLGTAHGYMRELPVDAENMLVPCPAGTSTIGYRLRPGVTITVEERPELLFAGSDFTNPFVPNMVFDGTVQTNDRLYVEGGVSFATAPDFFSGLTIPGTVIIGSGGSLFVGGEVHMQSLPTSDPLVAGELWNNAGVVNVSAG